MHITYLLTPWCRVLLEKLTGLQLVKKFPAFYGTRRFITALTSIRLLSLSWASPIQSTYPHPTSWGSILILSTYLHLGLPRQRMCTLVSLSLSVCPSFHMHELKICWMNYHEIWYVGVILNSVKTFIQSCLTFTIPGWHRNFNAWVYEKCEYSLNRKR